MGKMRVQELARELGRENREIMAALEELGAPAASHVSTIDDDNCEKIRRKFVKKTMTKEPENMNEKKTEENTVNAGNGNTGAEPKPKKEEYYSGIPSAEQQDRHGTPGTETRQ